jgi:hypothetical protein
VGDQRPKECVLGIVEFANGVAVHRDGRTLKRGNNNRQRRRPERPGVPKWGAESAPSIGTVTEEQARYSVS